MRRASLVLGIPAALLLICQALPASAACNSFAPAAQSEHATAPVPTKKQFKGIIESAKKASRLDRWQGGPFHLVAKVHYSLGSTVTDGMYEMLWASKDQMRINFKLGDSAEAYVVTPTKVYHWRTSLAIYLPMMEISSMVQFPLLIPHESSIKLHKVYTANRYGLDLVCGEIDDALATGEICADAATRSVVSMHAGAKPRYQGNAWLLSRFFAEGSSVAASGTVPDAPAWYPARIERHIYDEHAIVNIVSFSSVQKFADDVFIPPKNATAYAWCAAPAFVSDVDTNPPGAEELNVPLTERTEPSYVLSMRINAPGELMAYYLIVGPDMRVTSVRALRANDPHSQKELDENFSHLTFPVFSCKGKRISREAIFFPEIEIVPRK